MRRIGLGLALVLVLGACGGGSSNERAADGRCFAVPAALVAAIESGLTASEAATSIRFARAVKSHDPAMLYFVSADLEGPGLEGDDDVATWAATGLGGRARIYAVDQAAREFTDWPDADVRHLTMNTNGARRSLDCVRAAAAG